MRSLVILVLLVPLAGADCSDELVLRANIFARAYNEYVHTRDAQQEHRAKKKADLMKLWTALYNSPCF